MRKLKVKFGQLKPTCETHVIHFDYTLEQLYHGRKRNVRLEMRNLKQAELQRLKNRGKKGWGLTRNEKIEDHEKQRLATLKRLKRGDGNELEWKLRLEVVASKQLRIGRGERRRKKSKTVKWCSYQTAQFGHGDGQRKKTRLEKW